MEVVVVAIQQLGYHVPGFATVRIRHADRGAGTEVTLDLLQIEGLLDPFPAILCVKPVDNPVVGVGPNR